MRSKDQAYVYAFTFKELLSACAHWMKQNIHVAVPGRNWTLFRCVFWPRYHVQSTIAQNFCYGWGSYTLHSLMRCSCIFAACMSPVLNGSFALQCFESRRIMQQNNVWFLPGIAVCFFYNRMASQTHKNKVHPHKYVLQGYLKEEDKTELLGIQPKQLQVHVTVILLPYLTGVYNDVNICRLHVTKLTV